MHSNENKKLTFVNASNNKGMHETVPNWIEVKRKYEMNGEKVEKKNVF